MIVSGNNIRKISKKVSILFIDEDILLLSQLLMFLLKYFQNIDTVDSIEKGKEIFKKKKYDIVIFNIKKQATNPIDICKYFFTIKKDVFLIVTSEIKDFELLKELLNLGVDKFIPKPFNHKELFKALYSEVINKYNAKQNEILKQQQNQLLKFLQEAFDSIPMGIILMTSQEIILVNKTFLQIFQINRELLLKRIKKISTLFSEKELKELSNREFIDFLLNQKNMQVTVLNTKYLLEITPLTTSDYFLLTFTNLRIFDDILENFRNKLYISKITNLPNIEYFRDRFYIFKFSSNDYYIFIFSIKNLNSITNYIGRKNTLLVIKKMLNILSYKLRKKEIENKVFSFDFGYNKFLIVTDKKNIFFLQNIIDNDAGMKFNMDIEFENKQKKSITIHLKFFTDFFKLDKDISEEKIIEIIFNKFENFV